MDLSLFSFITALQYVRRPWSLNLTATCQIFYMQYVIQTHSCFTWHLIFSLQLPLYMTLGDMICCGLFIAWQSGLRCRHWRADFPADPIKQGVLNSSCSSAGHISMAWTQTHFLWFLNIVWQGNISVSVWWGSCTAVIILLRAWSLSEWTLT